MKPRQYAVRYRIALLLVYTGEMIAPIVKTTETARKYRTPIAVLTRSPSAKRRISDQPHESIGRRGERVIIVYTMLVKISGLSIGT